MNMAYAWQQITFLHLLHNYIIFHKWSLYLVPHYAASDSRKTLPISITKYSFNLKYGTRLWTRQYST